MKIRFATSFARNRIDSYMEGREYDVEDHDARQLVKAGAAIKVTEPKGKKPHVLDTKPESAK